MKRTKVTSSHSSHQVPILQGIRVLDFTRVVSGPFATMQLGDLGADIVKVEEPSRGDESRSYGPPFVGGESVYFLSINRNKRSVIIDLKTRPGRELILRLAKVADVVVENFRPTTLDRLGIGFDTLTRENKRLVFCSISGFGRTGPDAMRPGYDLIIQGEAGLMDLTGELHGIPTKVGTAVANMITALYATQAILAALIRREHTGRGTRLDVSMLDSMASLLTFNAGIYFATGQSPRRRGNAHPTICPYESFEAEDGWINVGAANDKFWRLLCGALEREDLTADPRFRRAADRVTHREHLKTILDPIFLERPRHHWMTLLRKAGVPCGAIKSVGEVCETPQLVERGVIRTVDHPSAGTVHYVASAIRFNNEKPPDARRPPSLGEHNTDVLADWLGLAEEEVRRYSDEGAFGSAAAGNASQSP